MIENKSTWYYVLVEKARENYGDDLCRGINFATSNSLKLDPFQNK